METAIPETGDESEQAKQFPLKREAGALVLAAVVGVACVYVMTTDEPSFYRDCSPTRENGFSANPADGYAYAEYVWCLGGDIGFEGG